MPYREAAKMATITRSIKLDNSDIFAAVAEWIQKHHPEQEMERLTLSMQQEKSGPEGLTIIVTWTVTKAVPAQ